METRPGVGAVGVIAGPGDSETVLVALATTIDGSPYERGESV